MTKTQNHFTRWMQQRINEQMEEKSLVEEYIDDECGDHSLTDSEINRLLNELSNMRFNVLVRSLSG